MPMPHEMANRLTLRAQKLLAVCPRCGGRLKRRCEIDGKTMTMREVRVDCDCGKSFTRTVVQVLDKGQTVNQVTFTEVVKVQPKEIELG